MYVFVVNELKEKALVRYNTIKGQDVEQLVSGSDDFTLFLWEPAEKKKPVARMTGSRTVTQGPFVCYAVETVNVNTL